MYSLTFVISDSVLRPDYIQSKGERVEGDQQEARQKAWISYLRGQDQRSAIMLQGESIPWYCYKKVGNGGGKGPGYGHEEIRFLQAEHDMLSLRCSARHAQYLYK